MAELAAVAAGCRYVERYSPGGAKILQVLSTRGDEGVIRLEGCDRDLVRTPKALLRFVRLARDLAHDAEIVQRVGNIRMERAEAGLLKGSAASRSSRSADA